MRYVIAGAVFYLSYVASAAYAVGAPIVAVHLWTEGNAHGAGYALVGGAIGFLLCGEGRRLIRRGW